MNLRELIPQLVALMVLPWRERTKSFNDLYDLLTQDGFALDWDDSNERYCIYALEKTLRDAGKDDRTI